MANVLSLFDGMACGMLAMISASVQVDRYVAYEIDKYATKTSKHNFPIIEQKGDVFQADFTEYRDFDWLVGGSPYTYWSIAQTKNRETTASGLGWELFSQYVRALREAKPKYFIYENNKSMSKDIRKSISDTFGFEPICINSALVSAQNRQRLYWVGIRNEDGTYRKANVLQPEDKGILLKDILETTAIPYQDKADVLTASYNGAVIWNSLERHQRSMVAEPVPVNTDASGKARTIIAGYGAKQGLLNSIGASGFGCTGVAEPINSTKDGKASTMLAGYYKFGTATLLTNKGFKGGANAVAEPVCVAQRGRNPENPTSREPGIPTEQRFEARTDQKTNTITTVQKDNLVAEPIEPICIDEIFAFKDGKNYAQYDLSGKNYNSQDQRAYHTDAKAPTISVAHASTTKIIEPIGCIQTDQLAKLRVDVPKSTTVMTIENHGWTNQSKTAVIEQLPECFRVKEATKQGYTDIEAGDCVDMSMPNSQTRRGLNMADKSNCLQTTCEFYQYCGTVKTPIYKVENGMITVKGKLYPIKLVDGYYIIRKLTVKECMRLQTVPEWYEFPVSNSQAYKMLGNGWTVEVIKHLITSILKEKEIKKQ